MFEKSLLENQDYNVREELKNIQKMKKEKDDKDYIDPVKAEESNETAKEFFK